MLKNILKATLKQINFLELREQEIMGDCINKKLERSLKNYESHLEDTCKYILMKNPISVIKALTAEQKPKTKEDTTNDL